MTERERIEQLRRKMLELMAEYDMCLAKVGRDLNYHASSVAYHMDKIKSETGLDPRTFHGLRRLLGYEKKEDKHG